MYVLFQDTTGFEPVVYKQKVGHLATAKRAEIAKLQALQLANNNPVASAMVKKQAETDYQVRLGMCGIFT